LPRLHVNHCAILALDRNPSSGVNDQSAKGFIVDEDQLRQKILELSPEIRRDTQRMEDMISELVALEREKLGRSRAGGFSQLQPKSDDLSPEQPNWPETLEYLAFAKLPMAKPKPLITNLLDCGTRILFGGGSKTFKTWLQCDLAVSLAAGAPWLGFECHPVRVLYVNLELREYYMQRRLAEIRRVRDISLAESSFFVWNLRGFAFSREAFVAELLRRCTELGINIVFVDPFYKLLNHLEDENNQTHMGAVLRSFDQINQQDITSAFGVHFSKGNQAGKEPEDRISGAGTIVRDADDVITLTKHEENLAFTLDFIIRDHPPIDSFVVRWQAPIMVRTDLDPAKIKKIPGRHQIFDPEDLFELIRANDDELSTSELQERAAEEFGWKERTFYVKLAVLKNQKRIFQSKLNDRWNVKVQK
jgi:AAA domain